MSGKNSANILSLFLESDTTLILSTVTSLKKVSISVLMPGNMSMISNLISFLSHHYSEHSEHAVSSLKIIKMFLLFVNQSLPKHSEPPVMLVAKQERRCKNSRTIILMQFWKQEISGLLRTILNKINRNIFNY